MSDQTPESAPGALSLPDAPDLDWLRKQAKRRLKELREATPAAKLADAQFDLAKRYGFASWRALKAHIDALTIDGQLFDAARTGDLRMLTALLDAHPDRLRVRDKPYEWTLLHKAAENGHVAIVDLLLARGLDVNTREKGDNTYAMHWAAAAGHLDVVRHLADAGGDVVGHGDDHELDVIGWATSWDGCDDAAHHAVADFLVSRGAKHNIFSAISYNLADEVRRIVTEDPGARAQPQSHNEGHRHPLHLAVLKNRPDMVELLLELGADPQAADDAGMTAAMYAAAPGVDERVIEALARGGPADLYAAVALGDWATAARLVRDPAATADPGSLSAGALHLMARRGDVAAVTWLLDHGFEPDARWVHWGTRVTALHLAAGEGNADVVRLLLQRGADATIHDSQHDADALGWAEYFKRPAAAEVLKAHIAKAGT